MLDHQFAEGSVVLVDAVDEDTALSVNGERVGGSVELPLVGVDEPRVGVGGGPAAPAEAFEDQPGDAV